MGLCAEKEKGSRVQGVKGSSGRSRMEIGWDFLFFCDGWVRWEIIEQLSLNSEQIIFDAKVSYLVFLAFVRYASAMNKLPAFAGPDTASGETIKFGKCQVK